MNPINSTVGLKHPHKFGFVEISDEIASAIDGGAFVSIKAKGGRRKLAHTLAHSTNQTICSRPGVLFSMSGATAIASGDNATAEVSVVSGGDDTEPIEIFASRSMVPAV